MAGELDPRAADRAVEVQVVEDLASLRVPPATYYAVFVQSPEGRRVLEDLTARFHDCELATDPERTHDVAERIGARRVVGFILRRLSQIHDADPAKN